MCRGHFEWNKEGKHPCAFCKTAYTPILELKWYDKSIYLCNHCLLSIQHASIELLSKLAYEEAMNHAIFTPLEEE
jgi:hypothetical protein